MALTDYSTTAASNTTVGGVDIQGTAAASNMDNGLRAIMADLATALSGSFTPIANDGSALGTSSKSWSDLFLASGAVINWNNSNLTLTHSAGALTLTSTDAGATIGPTLDLYRNSATPAANDVLGGIKFTGEDSAGNTTEYARIQTTIADPTNLSEDTWWGVQIMKGGTLSNAFSVVPGGITIETVNAATANFAVFNTDSDANAMVFQGGNTASQGAQIFVYGDGHSTNASDIRFVSANVEKYRYDASNVRHFFDANVVVGQNSTSTPGASNNTIGASITASGGVFASANPGVLGASIRANITTDGTVITLQSGGTQQGAISIAGATTTYAAFFGSHWAQLADGTRPDILRGTICESIDQMSSWPLAEYTDEDGKRQRVDSPAAGKTGGRLRLDTGRRMVDATIVNESDERLPCFKISDTPGSKSVYGVFGWWDAPGPTNDAHIGSLGAYVIRIAAGQTVNRGDYIESAGNGCGRVQADDILRASTVAKVTSAAVVETYPDGSYIVPCTLHCG